MIKVEWCNDKSLILSTITNPFIYPYVADDNCPLADNFQIPELNDDFFCAACYEDDKYLGCFCFVKKSESECEIHTCLLPSARGLSKILGDLVIRLVFETTNYKNISTFIPETNPLAKKLAIRCGFTQADGQILFVVNEKKIPTYKYLLRAK